MRATTTKGNIKSLTGVWKLTITVSYRWVSAYLKDMFKSMSKTLQGRFETHQFSEFAALWVKQTLCIHPSTPLPASHPDSVTTRHALPQSPKEHLRAPNSMGTQHNGSSTLDRPWSLQEQNPLRPLMTYTEALWRLLGKGHLALCSLQLPQDMLLCWA